MKQSSRSLWPAPNRSVGEVHRPNTVHGFEVGQCLGQSVLVKEQPSLHGVLSQIVLTFCKTPLSRKEHRQLLCELVELPVFEGDPALRSSEEPECYPHMLQPLQKGFLA